MTQLCPLCEQPIDAPAIRHRIPSGGGGGNANRSVSTDIETCRFGNIHHGWEISKTTKIWSGQLTTPAETEAKQ